jgi:hypothetical protein
MFEILIAERNLHFSNCYLSDTSLAAPAISETSFLELLILGINKISINLSQNQVLQQEPVSGMWFQNLQYYHLTWRNIFRYYNGHIILMICGV